MAADGGDSGGSGAKTSLSPPPPFPAPAASGAGGGGGLFLLPPLPLLLLLLLLPFPLPPPLLLLPLLLPTFFCSLMKYFCACVRIWSEVRVLTSDWMSFHDLPCLCWLEVCVCSQ